MENKIGPYKEAKSCRLKAGKRNGIRVRIHNPYVREGNQRGVKGVTKKGSMDKNEPTRLKFPGTAERTSNEQADVEMRLKNAKP